MGNIFEQITDWIKGILVSGIMGNLTDLFTAVNGKVGEVATDVGTTPANFSPEIFAMIRNISETVIVPIAGCLLYTSIMKSAINQEFEVKD